MVNIELERAVIAQVLQNPSILAENHVGMEHFFEPRHKMIVDCINFLKDNGKDYGYVMVKSCLASRNLLNHVDENYFNNLIQQQGIYDIKACLLHLEELSVRRQISDICFQSSQAVANAENIAGLLSDTVSKLNNTKTAEVKTALNGNQVAQALYDSLIKTAKGDELPYIKTGFDDLDNLLFKKTDLVYIAGRPSMGKTTFAQNIFMYLSQTQDGIAVFFSLEMPVEKISQRLAGAIGTVRLSHIATGGKSSPTGALTEKEWTDLSDSIKLINDSPIVIDDNKNISIPYIRQVLNEVKQTTQKEISCVVIDYIGLMQEVKTSENRNHAMGVVSMALKDIAKEYDTIVFCLAQLNRNLESRPNKRPMMSDLRDSGSLEQDADKILFIYRDEVYNPNSKDKGVAEIIAGKNRDGHKDTIRLGFQGEYSRFTNLTQAFYQQYENVIPFTK